VNGSDMSASVRSIEFSGTVVRGRHRLMGVVLAFDGRLAPEPLAGEHSHRLRG